MVILGAGKIELSLTILVTGLHVGLVFRLYIRLEFQRFDVTFSSISVRFLVRVVMQAKQLQHTFASRMSKCSTRETLLI